MNSTYATHEGIFHLPELCSGESYVPETENDEIASAVPVFQDSWESVPEGWSNTDQSLPGVFPHGDVVRHAWDGNQAADDWSVQLGRKIDTGEKTQLDLQNLAHTLVVGRTRSGKSTWIRGLAYDLLAFSPRQVALSMVDPKRTEFGVFRDAPQLVRAIITEPEEVLALLRDIQRELFKRFRVLERLNLRSVFEASRHGIDLPFPVLRVIVIDEVSLLIMQEAQIGEVLTRIGSVGAAAGVVLILATQQASVKKIPSALLANAANRVCFGVSHVTQSVQALGIGGAQKLKKPGEFICTGPACDDGQVHGRGIEILSQDIVDRVTFARERFATEAIEVGVLTPVLSRLNSLARTERASFFAD